MKDIELSNGMMLPPIGFGSYKIPDGREGVRIVRYALGIGYRLIDTAAMYGNETIVGEAIREALANNEMTRDRILVTTKLANTDRGYDKALRAFSESEKRLGLGKIDLYLVHWPASAAQCADWEKINSETWRALETIYEEGRVGAIGVSNFMPEHLDALAAGAKILPMVNQIEYHPGFMQREVTEWCREHDVAVEAWSPLGRTRIMDIPLLNDLARKYECSVAQICLRWETQHGVIPLPKSLHYDRMKENISMFRFTISDADMEAIDNLPTAGESGLTPDTITF